MKNGIEIEHNEKQGNYFEYVFHVYNCYRFLSLVLRGNYCHGYNFILCHCVEV